jgi:hypothetical protein
MARQNRDAVIGLLGHGHAFIAQVFEYRRRKLRPLQFLQQQYIGLASLQPRGDMVEPRTNRIDIPASDFDNYPSASNESAN